MTRTRLKIAFISTMRGSQWGGSEELWSLSAVDLLSKGHNVSSLVIEKNTNHKRLELFKKLGGKLIFIPKKSGLRSILCSKINCHLPNIWVLLYIYRFKPDIIVISQGYAYEGIYWMKLCSMLKLKYTTIIHANSEIWWPQDNELTEIGIVYKSALKIFFVSKSNRDLFMDQCGCDFGNMELTNNPWNPGADEPVHWPRDSDKLYFACIARLDPRAKGQDLIIKVLAMPKWKKRPVVVRLYGDGPCKDSLRSMASSHNLDNILFMGHVPDIKTIWEVNHALILPSRYEGMPIVIIESMLSSRAVICTDIAGNAEHIDDNINGFVARSPTIDSLDDAMERAWLNRDKLQSIGSLARAKIISDLPRDPVSEFSKAIVDLANK
jgi:glycosyltransferase involved in cell wall biosynthesis